MDNDNELLEDAAGAVNGGCWHPLTHTILWRPLADDGDAFRLAVHLRLEIDICRTGVAVRTPDGLKVLVSSDDEKDAATATRRAIVRAAAAMRRAAVGAA